MREFMFFLTGMAPFVLHAQLTGPSILPGDTVIQQVLSFYDIPDPAADGSTVWEGATGDVLNESMSVVFSAPLTPWGKSFPQATFGVDGAGTMTYYSFANAHTYHGGVQNGIEVIYDDPEVYMPLPFGSVAGETWTDGFAASYAVDGETYVRSGSVTATYNGMGTLNLPGMEPLADVHCVDIAELIVDTLPAGWVYTIDVNSRQLLDGTLFVPRLTMVALTETLYNAGGEVLDAATSSFGLRVADYVMDVEAFQAQPHLTLFPNPLQQGQSLQVVWGTASRGPGELVVHDGMGREVWRERVWPGTPATSLDLPTHLPAGTYFLSTTSGTFSSAQPFVIQP